MNDQKTISENNNNQSGSKNNIQRQTAFKTTLSAIKNGEYVKGDGWNPNYVITPNNKKVSRVNIIGIVVTITENPIYTLTLEDGTDNISIRIFEMMDVWKNIKVGETVLFIGRVR